MGAHLAKMLSNESNEITVIDPDPERIRFLSQTADVATILGGPSSIPDLKEAGAASADLFIAVNPLQPQSVNIVSALLAKKLGTRRVVARVDDEDFLSPENKLLFKDMGLDMMFFPEKSASDEVDDMLRSTASTDTLDFARGKLQLGVFKLDDDSPLLDMTVAEFSQAITQLPNGAEFRIVAISRGNSTIIPKFDSTFKPGDYLYIISCRDGMPALMKYLGKDKLEIRRVLILGGSEIGQMVAARLAARKMDDIKIIDINPKHCRYLSEVLPDSVSVACGDVRNADFLKDEGMNSYHAVLAFTGSDETNILSCVVAKKMGVSRVIAQVENLEYIRLAEDMGVDSVINKKLITASYIARFIVKGDAVSSKWLSGTNAEVIELIVGKWSPATRKPIGALAIPDGATIGGVIRGRETLLPNRELQLQQDDKVVIFALPKAMTEMAKLFD